MSVTGDSHAANAADAEGKEVELDGALSDGLRLVALLESYAGQLGFSELGAIDLPPIIGTESDAFRLRAAAALYLASELESAQLLPAVETLAGLFASGGLGARRNLAMPLLYNFWRGRRERFSRREREAFFVQLFGWNRGPALAEHQGPNDAFEPLLKSLALALRAMGALPAIGDLDGLSGKAPVTTAASDLAANLIPRASGLVLFAARDILQTVSSAVQILKQDAVQAAIGARSVWGAVAHISERYSGRSVAAHRHLTRGESGMTILAWLAEVVPLLSRPETVPIDRDHPAVAAADAWLHASGMTPEPQALSLSRGA